jgi:hypothetical protein
MNFRKLANLLQIDDLETFYRIKKFQNELYLFLKETESEQDQDELRLSERDLVIITEITNYCCNNTELVDHQLLLEIVLLYYSIMEVLSDKHTTGTLENYFGIECFTDILLKNIGSFSKPYFMYYQRSNMIAS